MDRTREAYSSLLLCDAVLNGTSDQNALDLARWAKIYWLLEGIELFPDVAEAGASAVDKLSGRFEELLGKMLK